MATKAKQAMLESKPVFYRVHLNDGKKFVESTRAWDVTRFHEALTKSYMEAKDGPHVVEFISEEEYLKDRETTIRKAAR